jgi:hypothetical protein
MRNWPQQTWWPTVLNDRLQKEPGAWFFNILGKPRDRMSHFRWPQPYMLFVPRNVGIQFTALSQQNTHVLPYIFITLSRPIPTCFDPQWIIIRDYLTSVPWWWSLVDWATTNRPLKSHPCNFLHWVHLQVSSVTFREDRECEDSEKSSELQPYKAHWLLYVPPGLTFTNSTFCPNSVLMYFVCNSEQTAIISLYSINLLIFITETGCVYCAVRAKYFNIIEVQPSLCNVEGGTGQWMLRYENRRVLFLTTKNV